ncbi:MAG: response regulator, partial [Rhodocyclaceae bacterium]|nr:response regulator [Rhodocyclaceae bacterium]
MAEAVKVLLVEDDEDVRLGAEQALELAGMDVESFESAERMRTRLAPGLRAVIVSDVRMPGMSGLDLLTLVTDTDRDLPVILVTGHGDISMAVGAMRRGAYDFIEKPFSSDHLVEVVQRAMEKRKLTL